MSEGRKRSRKSKLVVRDDDCEYEVVSEKNDETTTPRLQKTLKLEPKSEFSVPPPTGPRVFDHDYCMRGFQGFAYPYYPRFDTSTASVRNSTIIAIQQTQGASGSMELSVKVEVEQFDEKGREMSLFPEINKSIFRRKTPMPKSNEKQEMKMCKYDPEILYKVSGEIAARSNNPADKILDIEMRNMWGNVLSSVEEVDSHEMLLQRALDTWQLWCSSSKLVRDCPLFYQCRICNLAWWRLQPFREHIKLHIIKNLKVVLKENIHECMIVASYRTVNTLLFIDIPEDCWKCGKDLQFHKDFSEAYICSRCTKCLYTCSAFSDHESTCLYPNLVNYNIDGGRQCTICKNVMNSLDGVLKHMILAHSVRSDVPVPVVYKQCGHCNCKYITYSTHNCTRSPKNSFCDYCCRKFAIKPLAVAHMLSQYNRPVMCRFCDKQIKAKCQEMEHLSLEHSGNYQLAYKCTICSNQYLLFIDEMSIKMHRRLWHCDKKSDKRRSFYEKMLVPKQCLAEAGVEGPLQSVVCHLGDHDYEGFHNIDADTSSTVLPSHSRKNSNDKEDFCIKTSAKPPQLCLQADVDITVDEVDIKKEPIDYCENGEVDYEEMLLKMFNQTNESIKPKTSTSINEVKTEEFDMDNVKIKTEPINDIDIIENPVGTVNIKSEPIDDSKEYREYQSQNIMYMELKNLDENQKESLANQENQDLNHESEDLSLCRNQNENQTRKYKNKKRDNQNKKNDNTADQDPEQAETLTVKVETDINMEDILTENIVIKNEIEDCDEISTESIPFEQLITDLSEYKDNINPDEMTFDVINPSGLYKKKKVYACHKCGYTAQHKQYRVHITSKCMISPGINGSYPCSKCGLTFVMFRNYVLHFDTHGYEVMACPKCGESFETLMKLLSHVHKHIKNNYVGIHVLNKGGQESCKIKKEVKCQECREIILQDEMFPHWEMHLTLKEKPTIPVPLQIKEEPPELTVDCERVTMNNKTLDPIALRMAVEHLQSTTSTEKECIICYRAFSRRYDVKRHIVEHLLMDAHMNKSTHKCFRCQICLEGFQHQEKYKFHMREHGAMPIFKCELCNKTFSDSSNFAKHKKTHNVRVLVCDLCNKKFHSRNALEKHIADHRNLPKTKCAFCERTFLSKQSYKRHRYQMHVKNKFKCVLCDISFPSLQQKWDHNWEVHKERKHNADCPICLKSFRKFQDVRIHARAEHRAEVHPIKQGRRAGELQFYKVRGLKMDKVTKMQFMGLKVDGKGLKIEGNSLKMEVVNVEGE